jgi:hypothetical protein
MAAAENLTQDRFRAIYRGPGQSVAINCDEYGGSIDMLWSRQPPPGGRVRCEFWLQPADEIGLALGPPVLSAELLLTLRCDLPGESWHAYAVLPDVLDAALARRCYLKLAPSD